MHLPSTPVLILLLAPFALWAMLFILAECGSVTLKPLVPWLLAACWIFWGAGTIANISNRRWKDALYFIYFGMSLVLGWLKSRYFFEDNAKPTYSLRSLLTVPQPTYVMVRDVAASSSWYSEKFGLRKLAEQPRPDGIALQFDEAADPVILVPKDPAVFRRAPVFFTRKVGKVRNRLIANGVNVSPVQKDRQGTSFFEILDSEGNTLEVSEQP
jgi:hypothetical protein